jgi:two-component system LytT family sensor kinase
LSLANSPKEKTAFIIIFSIWWSFWGQLQVILLNDLDIVFYKIVVDSLICNGLLAVFCLLVIKNMRYYLPGRERYLYTLIVSFALSSIWIFLSKLVLKALYKTDPAFMQMMTLTTGVRYAFGFLMLLCTTMISLLWYSQQEQIENNQRNADTERLAREAELNKLRQQFQPHFLFNSLNSISALTGSQPEKARHMIQQLADFLRGTLKKEEQQWTSFEDELQYLQLYLDIEKVRFGYRLQTDIQLEENVLQMKLPSLLLQPLVENAIKFGLYDTVGDVAILIAAKNNAGMLEVTVQNPFDESTAVPVKGTGFGLSSIKRRLFLLFARQDLLQVKKETGQFITIISIPQIA